MSIRILTKNTVENTNIDGARDHNFNAGRRSGIVQGALNSGNLFLSANNTIALDTCELRLCGHRVVIDSAEYKTFYNQPSVPIRYSLVAQIIVSNNGESVSFDLKTQLSTIPLVQNDLDKNINGTYELEIGRFTQLTDGTLTDVVRTADLITGGGNNDSEYIRIGTVTTNKISPELDADVDIENTINPDDNKPQTNFTFNLPTSVGTVVSVNGEEKTSINTDITPIASSENLITSGGVHDYPAVTFAESERQKSKNLVEIKNGINVTYSTGMHVETSNDIVTVSGTVTGGTAHNITTFSPKIYSGKTYTLSFQDYSNLSNFEIAVTGTRADGTKKYNMLNVTPTTLSKTITADNDYTLAIEVFSTAGKTVSGTFKLQLEEGSVATDYQQYNGAIVHEKDIADVEHIEVLYDKTSSDANINKGLTSGCQFNETGANSVSLETSSISKYKGLNVYVYAVNQTLKVYLPVNKSNTETTCRTSLAGQNGAVNDSNILYGSLRYVYGNLYPTSIRERTLSSENIYQNNSSYYVSKIEGVY